MDKEMQVMCCWFFLNHRHLKLPFLSDPDFLPSANSNPGNSIARYSSKRLQSKWGDRYYWKSKQAYATIVHEEKLFQIPQPTIKPLWLENPSSYSGCLFTLVTSKGKLVCFQQGLSRWQPIIFKYSEKSSKCSAKRLCSFHFTGFQRT